MPNIEEDIQNEFINIVTKRNKEEFKDAYNVYQKLVYYRYEEVIKNTFIEFKKYISAKELEESIRVFLKEPCSTEFVWKIANDYRKFVKKIDYFMIENIFMTFYILIGLNLNYQCKSMNMNR